MVTRKCIFVSVSITLDGLHSKRFRLRRQSLRNDQTNSHKFCRSRVILQNSDTICVVIVSTDALHENAGHVERCGFIKFHMLLMFDDNDNNN